MTANAILHIPGGANGGQRGGGARPGEGARAGYEAFGAALLRVARADIGAAAALAAQDPPGEAQGRAAAGEGAEGQQEERGEGRERAEGKGAAAGVVGGAPLTIDDLNAMLLVGRGVGERAGDVARNELRSAKLRDAGGTAGAGGAGEGSGRAAASGEVKESAIGMGSEPALKGEGRGEIRAEARGDAGAEQKSAGGREAGGEQRGGGDAARQDGRGREGASRHVGAAGASGGSADPLRALAARGLGMQAGGAKGVERGGGTGGPQTLAVRPIAGAARGEAAGRMAKADAGSPASGAARRAALAAQMTRILSAAAAKGGGTMTMRLAPESLGAVTVRVGVEGGVVSARFEAANAAARDLLDSTMTALRSSLEAKGLSVERLQVELAPQGENADRAPEDQGAGGGWSESLSSGEQGDGGGGGGGSADGRAGESGSRERVRDQGAEPPVAGAPDDRTEAAIGAGYQDGVVMYLGLDAVA